MIEQSRTTINQLSLNIVSSPDRIQGETNELRREKVQLTNDCEILR
jgi:hypothetical protein